MIGFNPDRHCGKVTGLAALGRHNPACVAALKTFFAEAWARGAQNWFDRMHGGESTSALDQLRELGDRLQSRFSREDLAFAIQWLSEQRVLGLIREHVPRIEGTDIAVSGGVFANVRINQKVKELGFRNIFIQPAMDDGGLSLGAALHELGVRTTLKPIRVRDMFLGPEYDEAEMRDALDRAGLAYERVSNINYAVACLVAEGRVVGRFTGAMEFGPRALGNRSILYSTVDPTVNTWLNKRLSRTEFMPFAPATLAESAERCYHGVAGCEHAAEFMTITFDCTEEMKRMSPAVVHVDGTARGQLVRADANPGFHEVISEYRKLTGIPSIVNTSFNMHESPIVMTPVDAVRSFLDGRLDYLALGPFLARAGGNASSQQGDPSRQ
jgi:carbamoyltransferase